MKITVRNYSNKRRNKDSVQELKDFCVYMAVELGVFDQIKEIRLKYRRDFDDNYYPKNKPMGGFQYLLNKGVVNIQLTQHWDLDKEANKEAVVHELTHVRQLLSGDLDISRDAKKAYWKGIENHTWKAFRDEIMDGLEPLMVRKYLKACFPWEIEVQRNLSKYLVGYE